jgi:hypothetical protein
LLCLQEDLIMPHHLSFYELIVNKARGKSGPLFDFGVKDDIRLLGDASVESQDVHAGKVTDLQSMRHAHIQLTGCCRGPGVPQAPQRLTSDSRLAPE